jgi:hypothetical protein
VFDGFYVYMVGTLWTYVWFKDDVWTYMCIENVL